MPTASTLRRRALTLGLALYVLSFFHRLAPGAIADDLRHAFVVGGVELGLLAATYFYVYTLLQIPTGVLADTLGPRRVLIAGGWVAGLGSLLFGLAPDFGSALCGRVLIGAGVAVTFVCVLKLIAAWWPERQFASLAGLTILIGNIGSLSAALPLAWASGQFGWRSVFVAAGGVTVLLALAVQRWLVDRPATTAAAGHTPQPWRSSLLQILANRATWPGFFAAGGIAGSYMAFNGLWAVPYLMTVHGLNRTQASVHVSLMLLGFAFGSLLLGRFSDRIGRRRSPLLALGLLFCLAFSAIAAAPWQGWLGWLLFAALGLGASSFTLCWSIAKEVNPPAHAGMAVSVVNSGMFLVVGALQPGFGWLIDHFGGGADAYRLALLAMVLVAWLGWLTAWACRETGGRNLWRPG